MSISVAYQRLVRKKNCFCQKNANNSDINNLLIHLKQAVLAAFKRAAFNRGIIYDNYLNMSTIIFIRVSTVDYCHFLNAVVIVTLQYIRHLKNM